MAAFHRHLKSLGASERVTVKDGRGDTGELFLDKGRLVDARAGDQTGQEAFYKLFSWTEGRFTVRAEETSTQRTIDVPLEMLLLEACRLQDETGRPA